MRSKGLGPREVARRAGMAPQHVDLLRIRPNGPLAMTLARLATALDVPIEAFFVDTRAKATANGRRRGMA